MEHSAPSLVFPWTDQVKNSWQESCEQLVIVWKSSPLTPNPGRCTSVPRPQSKLHDTVISKSCVSSAFRKKVVIVMESPTTHVSGMTSEQEIQPASVVIRHPRVASMAHPDKSSCGSGAC